MIQLKSTYRAIQLIYFSLYEWVHLFYLNGQSCDHRVFCSKYSSVTILISMRSVVMVFHPFLTLAICVVFYSWLAWLEVTLGGVSHADFWYHLNQKILIHAFFFFFLVFTTVLLVRYSYYYFIDEEIGSQILFYKQGEEYHRCCRDFSVP